MHYIRELQKQLGDEKVVVLKGNHANTIRTFISEEQMSFLDRISRTCSMETINREAAQMVLSNHDEIVWWIQNMPSYYETDSQIFVHAGIDEEAGEYWMWGSSDDIFLWKFPASKGKFMMFFMTGRVTIISTVLYTRSVGSSCCLHTMRKKISIIRWKKTR